ncbi:YeeE/YedE thiosulfate transporter family protein [Caulobacter sp. 1776]|uniref:YeeE/YedE thiosulfate transporter family protein n=1 Tax=Caulobacter sp. 1776 TaxID=3156420 RepID=UPI003392AB3F
MSRRPYANPYLAGVGLGLVLLASFALTGQGLGASGAFARVAVALIEAFGPKTDNAWVRDYASTGAPWSAWIVVEVAGILVGAMVSAMLAGRFKLAQARPGRARFVAALGGGALMGVGAALARGCTSGLALSGGALLSVGAWLFMAALFIGGFLAAPLARRLWP